MKRKAIKERMARLENTPFEVYGLQDPANGQVFYIGSGISALARFSSHLTDQFGSRRKVARIAKIKARGQLPVLIIFKTVIGITAARIAELEQMEMHPKYLTNGSYPISSARIGRPHRVSLTRGLFTVCVQCRQAIDNRIQSNRTALRAGSKMPKKGKKA